MQLRGLSALALVALVAAGVPRAGAAETTPSCNWLAGDLHVHTVYSHDSYGGPTDDNTDPQDAYTLGWTVSEEVALAKSRGLDYVAITDHNDVRSQSDAGWALGKQLGLVMVPAYENSTPGHSQMLGATRVFEDTTNDGVGDGHRDFDGDGDQDLADIQLLADQLHALGGVFQINHPGDGNWIGFLDHAFVPDTVEIWNIGAWAYEPPFPATENHETPLQFYDAFLDAGNHVGATGGSDSHWRSTTAAQGVGQPTTWVCASDPSSQAVLDGLRAGRTTIADQPPAYGGPFAELRADGNGDGAYESLLGSTVTPGSRVQASVQRAPGAVLRFVTDGGANLSEVPITSTDFTTTIDVPETSTWLRAEVFYPDASEQRAQLQPFCDQLGAGSGQEFAYCTSRLGVVALTSPIYFESQQFDPATTLTYDGTSSTKVGSTATLAATLVGSDGPVSGAAVAFTYRGATHVATTDGSGRATVEVRVVGPPGTYEVSSSFAGTDRYSASEDHDQLGVTAGAHI